MDSILRPPIGFAHRGARAHAPENTLAAFDLALRMGAHEIELDVQTTRDGHVVVIHDDSVDRTTDGTGPVAGHTLSDLRALDAGARFGAGFAGERIPLLDEVLWYVVRSRWAMVGVPASVLVLLDSTVVSRYGQKQAGAERGYNAFAHLTWSNWSFMASFGDRKINVPTGWYGTDFGDPGTSSRDAHNFIETAWSRDVGRRWNFRWSAYYDQYRYFGRYDYTYEGLPTTDLKDDALVEAVADDHHSGRPREGLRGVVRLRGGQGGRPPEPFLSEERRVDRRRQRDQRSCPLPASRVVPRNPMTATRFMMIL